MLPPVTRDAEELPVPCPVCGYDLSRASSDRCPECGWQIDEQALREASIPWQQVGGVRGFLRTLRLALRHPRALGRQALRPVQYRPARRFQVICVLLAWLPIAPLMAWGMWSIRGQIIADPSLGTAGFGFFGSAPPTQIDAWGGILADAAIVAAALLGLFLWPLLATGVPSYFFHPKRLPRGLQDRAISLSYYAAAPLTLVPLVPFLAAAAGFVGEVTNGDLSQPLTWVGAFAPACAAALIAGVAVADLIVMPLILLRVGLHASLGRVLLCGLTTLIGWIVLFPLLVIGLPLLVLYAQIALHALAR